LGRSLYRSISLDNGGSKSRSKTKDIEENQVVDNGAPKSRGKTKDIEENQVVDNGAPKNKGKTKDVDENQVVDNGGPKSRSKTKDTDENQVFGVTKRQVEKLQSRLRRKQFELKRQAEEAEHNDTSIENLLSISSGLLTTREATLRIRSLKHALLSPQRKPKGKKITSKTEENTTPKVVKKRKKKTGEEIPIGVLSPDELDFEPIEHEIPPVPKLSHGLDRVLFNSGVYRLQDPRSRVYNFDPYLERIMPVAEFDFDALSEYKTSSKDPELLALTKKLGTKFTGSTSSMSGVLQHFHFLLSRFRPLNHDMLSRKFPESTNKYSKITRGPSAIFLRWKDGQYAIDADKSFDSPNIMSWLGHSLEKLLTNSREEFERYRRSSPEAAPDEDESGKCFHYSKLGNFLMRSQLDAHDSRLPGTGIFDLKTRAVVSIRMDHTEYETGSGYQIRFDRGEWESYEREFYDMTRATMLKYSLQVRMGRMDGIFVAYHNIERMFGFQYLSLPDMDDVLHGQSDTCLGDQEFKISVRLLDEALQRATEKFPETVSHSFPTGEQCILARETDTFCSLSAFISTPANRPTFPTCTYLQNLSQKNRQTRSRIRRVRQG
jgi:hypothetical protein